MAFRALMKTVDFCLREYFKKKTLQKLPETQLAYIIDALSHHLL